MSIIIKWIDLIHKTATGNWKTKLIFAPIVGLFYLTVIGFFIYISFIFDKFVNFPGILINPWNLIIGIPVVIIGFTLMFFSVLFFLKVKGTPVPLSPPPKLVKSGLYKYVRNPMLTGIFVQLFGCGIITNSISLIFIFTPLFMLINIWELKMVEEPELEKRLGKDYIDYKKQVPMFFPWFSK
jgi:protein-S-isoprenylcysteine O-methyltransferase Ste14